MSRRKKRPTGGAHAYDDLAPLAAVLAAWDAPADQADYDILTRERVREASPQLGRALDRLAIDSEAAGPRARAKMVTTSTAGKEHL